MPVATIKVPACQPWVSTPATGRLGQTMALRASGYWWDFYIRSGPCGYPAAAFYALGRPPRIIDEGRNSRLLGRIYDLDRPPPDDAPSETFVIECAARIEAPRDGRLYVFANDGAARYFNNWGAVTLEIELH